MPLIIQQQSAGKRMHFVRNRAFHWRQSEQYFFIYSIALFSKKAKGGHVWKTFCMGQAPVEYRFIKLWVESGGEKQAEKGSVDREVIIWASQHRL
ncbi:hypothetical protein [Gemmiger sp. An50]|uniref:hypothetical protein n=1 Tax=Gemmiger sp. An50 TaxID=1965639 RepID=UPI00111F2B78|nr:hypothetical protein [Gemmiger sp. An50]